MEEIGNLFSLTREAAGISIKEVSTDLNIEPFVLENIEDGKTGAFADVFQLKKNIAEYAKYLGLDSEKIIDEFNEYIFESTSKIPVKEIEKQIVETKKEEETNKVVSPYTRMVKKSHNGLYALLYVLLIAALIVATVWSVKQITVSNVSATSISIKE